MNSTKRKIGTLIATLGLAVTAGGVTAALAAGSSTPSPASVTISNSPQVNDDGTADQGRGDQPAEPGEDHGGHHGDHHGNEHGHHHGEHRGPGHANDDGNRGPGNGDDDGNRGPGSQDDGSGHDGGNSGHGDGGSDA
jgi:hypothetical protein